MGKSMGASGKMGHNTRSHKAGRNRAPSGLQVKRKTKRGWTTERVR